MRRKKKNKKLQIVIPNKARRPCLIVDESPWMHLKTKRSMPMTKMEEVIDFKFMRELAKLKCKASIWIWKQLWCWPKSALSRSKTNRKCTNYRRYRLGKQIEIPCGLKRSLFSPNRYSVQSIQIKTLSNRWLIEKFHNLIQVKRKLHWVCWNHTLSKNLLIRRQSMKMISKAIQYLQKEPPKKVL